MHTTEIINAVETDEAIAITVRCCGNSKTDSVLTVYGVHKVTPEILEAEIERHHDRVATKHQAMGKAKDFLANITTKTKAHN